MSKQVTGAKRSGPSTEEPKSKKTRNDEGKDEISGKKTKCTCSVSSCGKKSGAKGVIKVRTGEVDKCFCTVEHLTKDKDQDVIRGIKRRIQGAESVALTLKKMQCHHCKQPCTGTTSLLSIHVTRPVFIACSHACFLESLKMVTAHSIQKHVKNYSSNDDEEELYDDDDDETQIVELDDDDTQSQ